MPDIAALTGRWDDLVARVRAAGKALLGAALEASAPHVITSSGSLTIRLDESNDFHARAIDQDAADIVAILREWFEGIERVSVHREDAAAPAEKPARVTDEMVKSQRLNTIRKKDPALDAAIDVLDLEIAE